MKRRILCLVLSVVAVSRGFAAETGKVSALPPDSLSYNMNEVVVTATRTPLMLKDTPIITRVITAKDIQRRGVATLQQALEGELAGVEFHQAGYGSSLSFQGLDARYVLFLVDGERIAGESYGNIDYARIPMDNIARIEIVRGASSVLYGSNAMGGVVNIVTRGMREDGVKTYADIGYGSYNTLQTEATNRIRKGRFTSVVSGSYNRTDGHRENMEFEQYGGYAKLGYDFNAAWKVWGDVNITRFKASNPGETDNPYIDNDSRITRGMASFALENHYEKSSGALSFFYNWGRHKINDGYHPGGTPQESHFNSKDRMLGVSWYQSATLFAGNRLTVGFDYQHFGGKSWNKMVATGEHIPGVDKQMDEFAGYVDFRQDLGDWLSLNAGIRVDHHSHVGTEWIPQGGLSFHLPEQMEMKAMVSKGFRNPTIREMYMFPPQNPDLRAESLMNYELSFSQRALDGALFYGINLYYIDGDNMIMTVPTDGKPQNINTGEIENWGVESNISYRITSCWQINANYSWLHMENPVVAAPGHKLYAGADFTQGRWRVSTGLQYIKDLYTNVNKGKERKESFVLWNLRANYRLCRYADIFVRGENLLAQRYEINAGFPMPKATFMGGVNINF